MKNKEICEIKRIFNTRLDTLDHILLVGEKHFGDMNAIFQERLAPDMLPFAAQIAFACNQPRGFSQWCAGEPIDNLGVEVDSLEMARSHIASTKDLVAGITADDSKLDEIKRVGLGPGRYCELPARQYVNDYLMPNLYFHTTTAYVILRKLGAPLGKSDFMSFLMPYIKEET
ncbi:DUF1993 domain-containing protein [Marinobacterium rhizophilum]|uniref:DUF1993 domain-containing protein n=1 Tax=Marinobacterium rhizophilum TaxID=420402 RepID=UPI00037E332F|nr:DUF1993 domain-containing protein [Marinobacterium rhizophilum]